MLFLLVSIGLSLSPLLVVVVVAFSIYSRCLRGITIFVVKASSYGKMYFRLTLRLITPLNYRKIWASRCFFFFFFCISCHRERLFLPSDVPNKRIAMFGKRALVDDLGSGDS